MKRNNIHVIIVNGRAQSGKTLFQSFAKSIMTEHDTIIRSSVTTLYDVYKQLGWNGIKNDTFRRDMALLKQIYVDNCDGPTRELLSMVICESHCAETSKPLIIFYDCREKCEIIHTQRQINQLDIGGLHCSTIYIQRDEIADIKHGNCSDDSIKYDPAIYDYILYNNSTVEDLYDTTKSMILRIINKNREDIE